MFEWTMDCICAKSKKGRLNYMYPVVNSIVPFVVVKSQNRYTIQNTGVMYVFGVVDWIEFCSFCQRWHC